jgi:hypothetical protein
MPNSSGAAVVYDSKTLAGIHLGTYINQNDDNSTMKEVRHCVVNGTVTPCHLRRGITEA